MNYQLISGKLIEPCLEKNQWNQCAVKNFSFTIIKCFEFIVSALFTRYLLIY